MPLLWLAHNDSKKDSRYGLGNMRRLVAISAGAGVGLFTKMVSCGTPIKRGLHGLGSKANSGQRLVARLEAGELAEIQVRRTHRSDDL